MAVSGVKVGKSKIIEAIKLKKGVITLAAEHINCTPATIYSYVNEDPEVAKALAKARADLEQEHRDNNVELLNMAYSSAKNLLKQEDATLTIFTLKTQGAWKEQVNHQHNVSITRVEKPFRDEQTGQANNDPA